MDVASAYRVTREGTTALLADAGPDIAERVVLACPQWTVRQVVAHLSGVCDDILNGRLEGAGTDPWTAMQVGARANRTLADLLDEWTESGTKVEETLGADMPEQLVFDEVSHEHDIRGTLKLPGAQRGDPVEIGLNFAIGAMDSSVTSTDLPAVLVRSDGQERTIGQGAPTTVLTASSFDLLRSFTGRRTADQICALDWGGADPQPWLGAFTYGPFELPAIASE